MRFWNKKALRCSGCLPKISKGLWESDHFWPQFWPELEAEQMEITELSGRKRVLIGQKRAKKSVYHLKNVNSVLWDQDVAGSNPVIPTKNQPISRRFHLGFGCFFMLSAQTGIFLTTIWPELFLTFLTTFKDLALQPSKSMFLYRFERFSAFSFSLMLRKTL